MTSLAAFREMAKRPREELKESASGPTRTWTGAGGGGFGGMRPEDFVPPSDDSSGDATAGPRDYDASLGNSPRPVEFGSREDGASPGPRPGSPLQFGTGGASPNVGQIDSRGGATAGPGPRGGYDPAIAASSGRPNVGAPGRPNDAVPATSAAPYQPAAPASAGPGASAPRPGVAAPAPSYDFSGGYDSRGALEASKAAIKAATDEAREEFGKDVGTRFGDLNAIGALRSGGATQAVKEAGKTAADRIGRASAATGLEYAKLQQQGARDAGEFGLRGAELAEGRRRFEAGETRADREFDESGRRYGVETGFREKEFGEGTRRFEVGEARAGRDEVYRTGRAARADVESDRGFAFDERRFGAQQGLDERRFASDAGYRAERANRADVESDRDFQENERRYGREEAYRIARDAQRDSEYEREFGYRGQRDTRTDYEADRAYTEDVRRYGQERADALKAQRDARKRSIWGAIGTIGGGLIGSLAGPIGAGIGAKLGGAIGGRASGKAASAGGWDY